TAPGQLIAAVTAVVAAAGLSVVVVALVVVVVALLVVVVDVSLLGLRGLRRLGRLRGFVLLRDLFRLSIPRLGRDLGLLGVQCDGLAVHHGPGERVRDLRVRRHAQRGHEHRARGNRDRSEERPSHCSPLGLYSAPSTAPPAAYQRPTPRESEPLVTARRRRLRRVIAATVPAPLA